MPPLEERTEYPYQNLRSKNFPWSNGDKVSFPIDKSLAYSISNVLNLQTLL
jgi:cytochrome c oxidase subunit VIa